MPPQKRINCTLDDFENYRNQENPISVFVFP
jgi:hypothetical protein